MCHSGRPATCNIYKLRKMEPFEAYRTDRDSIGSSKRRISSILKAPRKSSVIINSPEREKSQVEHVKPVEKKRISRRVSFATSNDVLLFPKDLKNGSPVRSPLQNLPQTATENTSAPTGSFDGAQPIAGMETLLNAPLHVLQQRTKEQFMFNPDDYGEKTVMFTGEDAAFMDMTHSHTILIANDSDCSVVLPHESNTSVLTSGNMDFTFSEEKKKTRAIPSEPNPIESKSMTDLGRPIWKNSLDGTHDLSNTSTDNIDDEVLPDISSEEDLSETVDTMSAQKVEDEFFEEPVQAIPQSQKRPLPEEGHENSTDEEKRWKPSTENIRETVPPTQVVQWDSNCIVSASQDSSNNSNIRCEGTFESSTYRQSQLEYQFEDNGDYMLEIRKKLQEGSITVTEFLKLFSIDFVIHKPRQSILPTRIESCQDRKTRDLLMEKLIYRPKQRVYETGCQMLTGLVDRLKVCLRNQDNLLKNVNPTLWEAVKVFSDEELQLFGAKLKEQRTFFRKRSKVQSHEMKSVLYLDLVNTAREAQQNLRGKIEKTDMLLTDLDECLHNLEAELAAVEGTGVEDSEPTLKSRQQGLENVNKAIAENERHICEIEMQKRSTMDRVDRLRKETLELENHIAMVDRLNEWKFVGKDDRKTVYSFLYESVLLEVHFEKSDGELREECERNITDITFQRQMDDEKSPCYARLVHNLLCQYIGNDTNGFKKYTTSRYIPKLLHDVGLVVSRCRLLGEEIHLMKKWGALRLNVLNISCVETQVSILFSSLKTFAKFEMAVVVSSSYPFCLLHVQNFQNHIGNTTKGQVEDIISSVTPAKNYLTKIIKKIHETFEGRANVITWHAKQVRRVASGRFYFEQKLFEFFSQTFLSYP
ncbi:hypothetical protein DPEC_G00086120 [Dallia pectoralis]|uniref:Uncharacterized protein n=1 Tax=Dallia pectoralis TaxID=75939 RepID=A0ACC2H0F2_DALPE|nr:hypothetical protein DPEC_G00086120 [Dallia pectoralis]